MKWLTAVGLVILTFIGILLGRRDDPTKAEKALRKRQEEQRQAALELNEAKKQAVKAQADTMRTHANVRPIDDHTAELLARIRKRNPKHGSSG